MLYIRKLLKDNKISIPKLAYLIDINYRTLEYKLALKQDFKLEELEKIKSVLLCMQIIPPTFDIGEFLTMV